MSFIFNWEGLPMSFTKQLKEKLEQTLNDPSNKTPDVVSPISIVELSLGSQAPNLQFRDIEECSSTAFKSIVDLKYDGEMSLTFQCKIQINSLTSGEGTGLLGSVMGFLATHKPQIMPFRVTLSQVRLRLSLCFEWRKNWPIPSAASSSKQSKANSASSSSSSAPAEGPSGFKITLVGPSSPFYAFSVTTNFDQDLPVARDTFRGMMESSVQSAITKGLNAGFFFAV